MVAQFAPTEYGRHLRSLWANPNLFRAFATDANGKWPELGCKLGQPRQTRENLAVCQDLGIQRTCRRVSPDKRSASLLVREGKGTTAGPGHAKMDE